MARPKKIDAPDLGEAKDLTAGLIERQTCPPGKTQVFMRDTKAQAYAFVQPPPVQRIPVA
jgi:hypothetical protein